MHSIRPLLATATLLLSLAPGASVRAAPVSFSGSLSFRVASLPAISVPASGTLTLNGSAGGAALASLAVSASEFDTTQQRLTASDPGVFPMAGVQLTARNDAATFDGSPLGGPMRLNGAMKVCLYAACGDNENIANLSVPLDRRRVWRDPLGPGRRLHDGGRRTVDDCDGGGRHRHGDGLRRGSRRPWGEHRRLARRPRPARHPRVHPVAASAHSPSSRSSARSTCTSSPSPARWRCSVAASRPCPPQACVESGFPVSADRATRRASAPPRHTSAGVRGRAVERVGMGAENLQAFAAHEPQTPPRAHRADPPHARNGATPHPRAPATNLRLRDLSTANATSHDNPRRRHTIRIRARDDASGRNTRPLGVAIPPARRPCARTLSCAS